MKRILAAVVLGCGISACSAGPTAPSFANVAGNWTGTFAGTQAATGSFIIAIVMNLTESNGSVSGTWATASANGTISGTTDTSTFTGTFSYNTISTTGSACTGTFAVSGSAGGNTLNWISPGVTGDCSNLPTNITIAVQLG